MNSVQRLEQGVEEGQRSLILVGTQSLFKDSPVQLDDEVPTSNASAYTDDRDVYGATVLDEISSRLAVMGLSRQDMARDDAGAMDIAWTTHKELSGIDVDAMLACTPWNISG